MSQPTAQERRIPGRTTRLSSYRRLFALPGARAFTAGNLLARLPMGMFSVSAVVMIAGSRGSYALAGAVTATGLAATAVAGPFVARLVDRHGQARIALPATVVSVLGSLALLLCVRFGAPDWTLFAAYAATATTPNTGGLSRARWAHLLRDDPGALHTANAFEQAADELCFMLGPVLASFLAGTLFPEAGTLAGAVLLLAGMLLFTAQRSTEPPPAARSQGPSPLRGAGIPALLVCFTATGAVFGSMEVVTIAYADAHGHRAAAGAVLALQA
uniref:MFS transporter n=1 Tax=Streptomyces sp. WELS2 TaxID=2749435 RepID=UPI0015F11AFD